MPYRQTQGGLNPGGAEMGCNARARRGLKPGVITNSRKVLGGSGDSFKSPPALLCPHPRGLGDSFKSPPAFLCPHPPDPLPLRGRGRLLVYFAGGWRPRHPCAEPLTALTNHAIQATPRGAEPGRCWLRSTTHSGKFWGVRGTLSRVPRRFFAPIPPTPFPGGEGGGF